MTLAGFLVAPIAASERAGRGGEAERDVRARREQEALRDARWDTDAHHVALAEQVKGEDATAAQRAFDALYESHFVPLWRLARQLTRSESVAKDVVQDVFVAVWTHRTEWQVEGSVRAYLYRSVRNRALNAVRDGLRRERNATDVGAETMVDGRPAGSTSPDVVNRVPGPLAQSPEARTEVRELERALAVAVDDLPERQRTALLLFWHESMNMSEIARVLGITPASSRKLLLAAQDKLRRAVAAYL